MGNRVMEIQQIKQKVKDSDVGSTFWLNLNRVRISKVEKKNGTKNGKNWYLTILTLTKSEIDDFNHVIEINLNDFTDTLKHIKKGQFLNFDNLVCEVCEYTTQLDQKYIKFGRLSFIPNSKWEIATKL